MAETGQNPYRVLIVDDESQEAELLADLLRGPNRTVEVLRSPFDALDYLEHHTVDLAFLDHMMPGMTGLELAKKIKSLSPRTHVVICTGYLVEAGFGDIRERAEHVLHKPLNLGEVLQLADAYCAS